MFKNVIAQQKKKKKKKKKHVLRREVRNFHTDHI